MADYDVTTDEEFFAYSSAYAKLAECAREHDQELYIRTGQMMDMSPVLTLRGLSYAGWMLGQIEEPERNSQWSLAQQAISELTSFVATVLEHQNGASCEQMALDQRAGRPI